MKRTIILLVLLAAAGIGGWYWWHERHRHEPQELTLYGNVDLRQVQLAFNNSERIAEVLVQEGDRVKQGQLLARLDTSRIAPQVTQAEAQFEAQQQVHKRLHAGSRPEEIAQARANVASAQADVANTRRQFERMKNLSTVRLKDQTEVRAVSQEDVDNAKMSLDVAEAKLTVNQKSLDLAVLGPRKEEVAEAEAKTHANKAQLSFLRQQLADTKLYAPSNATVRSRLMEPGEMASPQKALFSLAITDPKWVRAYVSEPDLGKVHPGMPATISVDSFPGRRFEGWVGFISPVSEFTPKPVQTEELRSSLVYEVRVFVKDPDDELRLGMPATVHLPLQKPIGAGEKENDGSHTPAN